MIDLAPSSQLKREILANRLAKGLFFSFALASVFVIVGIVAELIIETFNFFTEDYDGVGEKISIWQFLTGTTWEPGFSNSSFGVLPLVGGTLMVTFGAAVIAIPVGMGAAIYLSEYAGERARNILKPILEVLSGIPTVVYGFFALTAVTPFLKDILPEGSVETYNALAAAIVVGIMILPMVASLSEDALRAVPKALRDGAYALGATKFEVSMRIVVPAALSGVTAAFVLALSRAIGETMAVTIAAGAQPNLTINFLESIETMTSFIAHTFKGDAEPGTPAFTSLFAVGMLLFMITLVMNIVSYMVLRKFREKYD